MNQARSHPWRPIDAVEAVAAFVWPRRWRGRTGWLFIAPAPLLVGILIIGLGYILQDSLHELDIATYRLRDAYSLANYSTLAEKPVYRIVLWRSILAALVVTGVSLVFALPYAYVLTRTQSSMIRKFLLIALFLPFFIGQVVRAYGWLIILGTEGLVNTFLGAIGIGPLGLLYNYGAVIFGLVQYMLPFAILLLLPALAAIPEEVERASEGLGANWIETFWHVILPMARPGLVGASVVVFTLTLTDFALPEILGGGKTDFIASAIYDSFFQISNAGLGSALSVVLVTIGTVLVGIIFFVAGTGTLGIAGGRK